MTLKLSNHIRSAAAFTMIEIAIALAVIAFALVAIIGVLPTGINVQKDNREDTIVNQDGPYWIEAIRNGSKGLDHLTNFVERIGVVLRPLDTNDTTTLSTNYAQFNDLRNSRLETGSNIVGLLTIPKWSFYAYNGTPQYVVRVEAQTRALTGSAVEQGKASTNFAFSYLLQSEAVPFTGVYVSTNSTNFAALQSNCQTDPEWKVRAIEWSRVKSRETNTTELRLTFRWPLLANGRVGSNFQRFRVIATGAKTSVGELRFIEPQTYAVVPLPQCP